jgi:MSHA biogenesis protein MshO
MDGEPAMRRTRPPETARRRAAGFTLLEAIVAMTVLSIVAGMVAVFLRAPIDAYVDTARRAELSDIADGALRHFDREVRSALPNSVRVTHSGGAVYLEFLQTSGAGRYRAAESSPGADDALDFSASDISFDILGARPAIASGAQLVIMNLGAGSGADAYAGDNRTAIQNLSGSRLSFTRFLFPYESPSQRFFVVEGPVTYVCDPAAGTLIRHESYPISTSQPTPPASRSSALVASRISACSFSYDAISSRTGTVTASLALTAEAETVRLFHQVSVSNAP